MNANPFTIREARVALYTVGAGDLTVAEVWIGQCPEAMLMDGEYGERALEFHGVPSPRVHQDRESYSVQLSGPWLHDQSAAAPRVPALRRNQRYALVVVWHDPDLGVWVKRNYGGVTAQPVRLEGDVVTQTVRLRAETLSETAGIGAEPSLEFAVPGFVLYRNGAENTVLYTYDFDAKTFAVVDAALLPQRAQINLGAGGCTIEFDGVAALSADALGVEITELVANGGTFIDVSPRIEFWRGLSRVASLSYNGLMAVANAKEQAIAPALPTDFEFENGGWIFSLSGAMAYAPRFSEV